MLECRNVRKEYGDLVAVREITYTFSEGVYGLLGPNGAGKSTWMKMLTSGLKPTKGEIVWEQKSIFGLGKDYYGKIGYVPQNQTLFSYYTGEKFLYYMAALKGVKKEDARRQIPDLLSRVNLSGAARQKIGTYSGGMKQRILVAQAFLGDPALILMDEPTAGLDPKERIRMRNMISEMAENRIVLIATHVVSDVEYIAKEILLLQKGVILQHGPAEQLEKEIAPFVFEVAMDNAELKGFMADHPVSGLRREDGKNVLRFLAETCPEGKHVRPTLDDVYLYHFKEECYDWE